MKTAEEKKAYNIELVKLMKSINGCLQLISSDLYDLKQLLKEKGLFEKNREKKKCI